MTHLSPSRIPLQTVAWLLVMACIASASAPSLAADPALPTSVAEAITMERADSLPLTPFYGTPSLDSTKPGELLRKEAFDGYAVPTGAKAVRILYHSLDAGGRDVATSGVVLIPAG